MPGTNVFSGARARFYIDTGEGGGPEKVAYAGGVSGEETIDYEPVDVLDMIETLEFVPIAYRCALNAQVFRVIGNSLKNLGIMPTKDNILTSGNMTATIEDRQNPGSTMAHVSGVKVQTKSWDVSARGIVAENISFVAILMKDESEV